MIQRILELPAMGVLSLAPRPISSHGITREAIALGAFLGIIGGVVGGYINGPAGTIVGAASGLLLSSILRSNNAFSDDKIKKEITLFRDEASSDQSEIADYCRTGQLPTLTPAVLQKVDRHGNALLHYVCYEQDWDAIIQYFSCKGINKPIINQQNKDGMVAADYLISVLSESNKALVYKTFSLMIREGLSLTNLFYRLCQETLKKMVRLDAAFFTLLEEHKERLENIRYKRATLVDLAVEFKSTEFLTWLQQNTAIESRKNPWAFFCFRVKGQTDLPFSAPQTKSQLESDRRPDNRPTIYLFSENEAFSCQAATVAKAIIVLQENPYLKQTSKILKSIDDSMDRLLKQLEKIKVPPKQAMSTADYATISEYIKGYQATRWWKLEEEYTAAPLAVEEQSLLMTMEKILSRPLDIKIN